MGSLCSWPSTRDTVASISPYVLSSTSSFSRGSTVVLQRGGWLQIKVLGFSPDRGTQRSCLPPPPRAWTHMIFCRHSIADRKHLSVTRECLCMAEGAGQVRPWPPAPLRPPPHGWCWS